ncbi:MAG: TolC family protein [Planctomycetota bacterium]
MRTLGVTSLAVLAAVLSGCGTPRHAMMASNSVERPAESASTHSDSPVQSAVVPASSIQTQDGTRIAALALQTLDEPEANTTEPNDSGAESLEPIDDTTDGSTLPKPVVQELPAQDPFATLLPASQGNPDAGLKLGEVVASVHRAYPELEVAYLNTNIAEGNQLAAWGAFDTKFKASTENGPLGFYETYRHGLGVVQPLYPGGEVFAGYRIGRGMFQPWYEERQTNDGGEFKAGFVVPLAKNRRIDARRADLWRATYQRQRVQPEIRAQLIMFVRDASIVYWSWIAAGQKYDVGRRALELVQRRNQGLERRVELDDVDPPVLQDNLRAIALREAKLIDSERKLRQTAIKLSLFLRGEGGATVIPDDELLNAFPTPTAFSLDQLPPAVNRALAGRPELAALDILVQEVQVDLAQASNDLLPQIDAQFIGSQDMGEPTSSKRDKSEFELEAGVFVDVPMQLRKGRGKIRAARAKLSQLSIKRGFVEDKITTEVQSAFAALDAAFQRVGQTRQARELAERLAQIERIKFNEGQSDLLTVFLREQSAIEAANDEIDSLLEYYIALANLNAALAIDWPTDDMANPIMTP